MEMGPQQQSTPAGFYRTVASSAWQKAIARCPSVRLQSGFGQGGSGILFPSHKLGRMCACCCVRLPLPAVPCHLSFELDAPTGAGGEEDRRPWTGLSSEHPSLHCIRCTSGSDRVSAESTQRTVSYANRRPLQPLRPTSVCPGSAGPFGIFCKNRGNVWLGL